MSRPTRVEAIGGAGLTVEIEAAPQERTGLARLNALPEVRSLTGSFHLRPEPRGGVWVTGEVRASVVQVCVVSLDPFEAGVVQPVDVHFLPEEPLEALRAQQARRRAAEPEPEPEEPDEPDLIRDGRIDLGALATEFFTLGLDPYPKKPGAVFAEPGPSGDKADESPFGALRSLRTDKD